MVAFVDKGRPSKNSLIALPRVCVFVMITARTRAAGSSVDALSQELDGSIRLVSNMSHGGVNISSIYGIPTSFVGEKKRLRGKQS